MYEKCKKCGRKLTDPKSISRGYGPECWGKICGSKTEQRRGKREITGQIGIFEVFNEGADICQRRA